MEPLYIGFADKNDVAKEFSNYNEPPIGLYYADIAIAAYTYESYDGDAWVLYQDTRDGLWYEVNGGHCSCYGLEGQWHPEEVDPRALLIRDRFTGHDWGGANRESANDRVKARVRELFGGEDANIR